MNDPLCSNQEFAIDLRTSTCSTSFQSKTTAGYQVTDFGTFLSDLLQKEICETFYKVNIFDFMNINNEENIPKQNREN